MPRWAQFLAFFAVAMLIWSGLHVYLHYRIVSWLHPGDRWRHGLRIAWIGLAVLFPAALLLRQLTGSIATPLLWVGFCWMGAVTLLVSQVVTLDLVLLARSLVARLAGSAPTTTVSGMVESGRRYAMWAIVILTLAGSAYAVVRARLMAPLRTQLDLTLAALPASADGLKIVHLSDMHIGALIGPDFVSRVVADVNAMKPDLVVISGDLIDEPVERIGPGLDALATLKAPLGIFVSVGNHEVYADLPGFEAEMKRRGLTLLRQRHVVVRDSLVIAGVDDPAALGRLGLSLDQAQQQALAGRPTALPVVLLSHRPLAFEQAAARGVDLMLAGHTHGGQLPPLHLLSRLLHRYMAGRYELANHTLYVNRGIGTWGPPMRLWAPPEIVCITLHHVRA